MSKQRIHANLAPIDLLTREELAEEMAKRDGKRDRERYRGIDSARLPPIALTSTGQATLNLYSGAGAASSDGDGGPSEGDVWLLRRANVVSSNFYSDPARYMLFRGSSPSDPIGGYTNRQLLNGMTFTTGAFVGTPAVPASGTAQQNINGVPVQVVVTGGTVTAVAVNGVTVGGGDGTYVVPAYGAITLTYSVAPTWAWTSLQNPTLGQYVGIEYDAPNKGCLLQPGEQLYAQVVNSTSGNTYLLTAEFIRCPAEMKGKLLG
jgi:hypothetical protein